VWADEFRDFRILVHQTLIYLPGAPEGIDRQYHFKI
jgi:hypothetical protein